MTHELAQQIRLEADFVERCAAYYRGQFDKLIEQMNHATTPVDQHSLRLCVEAIDVLLSNQNRLAKVLERLVDQQQPVRLKTAA